MDMYQLTKWQKIYRLIKRIFDFIFALMGMVVLAMPMLIIALITKLNNIHYRAFFTQRRVGKDEKTFQIYKFRTLKNVNAYISASQINYKCYSNKWEQFLRKSSLDEIPQLINILKGDMSLIGPRPLIPNEEAVHKMREQKGVYQIYPGLTGLAQVKGRNSLDISGKVNSDYEYLKNYGFIMDMKIIGLSIVKVLGRKDI
jgi:O-antigen biosynthesis protein WbqP